MINRIVVYLIIGIVTCILYNVYKKTDNVEGFWNQARRQNAERRKRRARATLLRRLERRRAARKKAAMERSGGANPGGRGSRCPPYERKKKDERECLFACHYTIDKGFVAPKHERNRCFCGACRRHAVSHVKGLCEGETPVLKGKECRQVIQQDGNSRNSRNSRSPKDIKNDVRNRLSRLLGLGKACS